MGKKSYGTKKSSGKHYEKPCLINLLRYPFPWYRTASIREGQNLRYALMLAPREKEKRRNNSRRQNGEDVRNIGYRFVGHPTKEQQKILICFIGSCRFLWNHMLSDKIEHYRIIGEYLDNTPADYKDIPELSWLNDCDSLALANVQLRLEGAFSDFTDGKTKFPKYKKKHLSKQSYTTNISGKGATNLRLEGNMLKLPKIDDPIELVLHRKPKPGGILKNCTVTLEPNGTWYFSLNFEYPEEEYLSDTVLEFMETGDVSMLRHTGLDMSMPYLYVDPEGRHPSYVINDVIVEYRKAYRALENRIAREQRKLSHMKRGSANYIRQQKKIAALHAKAKHQRRDFLHQISARLTKAYDVISLEDLDMAAMKRSLNLGKSASDNGWGMFVNMLVYKATREGHVIMFVSKWFPSSKTCSECGYVHRELKLSDRTYVCPVCGHTIDRDEQAAGNIDMEGLRLFVEACTPVEDKKAA